MPKIEIKRRDAGVLLKSLEELDKAIMDGKIKFSSHDKVTYARVFTTKRLKTMVSDITDTRDQIVRDQMDDQKKDADAQGKELVGKHLEEANRQMDELLKGLEDLEVRQVPLSSLELDKNTLPASALADLIDIVFIDDMSASEPDAAAA